MKTILSLALLGSAVLVFGLQSLDRRHAPSSTLQMVSINVDHDKANAFKAAFGG